MGTDIHCVAQKRNKEGKWENVLGNVFDWRSYGLYGFLADVRNYSMIKPLSRDRGFPEDFDADATSYGGWDHSAGWLSMEELTSVDYDEIIEDRRTTKQIAPGMWSGAEDAGEGNGAKMPLREFLDRAYFDEIKRLNEVGAERIVFWFDS